MKWHSSLSTLFFPLRYKRSSFIYVFIKKKSNRYFKSLGYFKFQVSNVLKLKWQKHFYTLGDFFFFHGFPWMSQAGQPYLCAWNPCDRHKDGRRNLSTSGISDATTGLWDRKNEHALLCLCREEKESEGTWIGAVFQDDRSSHMVQWVKNTPAMQEVRVRSLGQEDSMRRAW